MKITVKTKHKYDVLVSENLLDREDLAELFPIEGKKAAIIWDEKIDPKPIEKIGKALEDKGVSCLALSLHGGEECKTLETYARIVDHLLNFNFNKTDLLIAVGGGTVLDLTGFIASTFNRGVKFVNVPTTLLSSIDASIGGKTALNYNQYKNVVGTIYQPNLVLVDTSIIDVEDITPGVSEIIKMGFMKDAELISLLNERPLKDNIYDKKYFNDIIARAIKIKADVVSSDELNKGERNLLNFGHTFGHAIESESKYKFNHGYSVALGMVIVTKLSEAGRFGDVTEKGTLESLKEVLKKNGIKTDSPYDIKTLLKAIKNDKKVNGDEILLSLPKKVGEGVLVNVELKSIY